MNDIDSTTAKAENLPDIKQLEKQWKSIDWEKVVFDVNRLQARIAKAAKEENFGKVKQLQYLLIKSFSAKALAVRNVTANKNIYISGIDEKLWTTPASKMYAVLSLTDKNYKAKPLKRLFIKQKGTKIKTQLTIPCMYDRAMQVLYALTLTPVAKITDDTRTFEIGTEESRHSVCSYICSALSKSNGAEWVLKGTVKEYSRNICFKWIIDNACIDKSILKQFLKAGFIQLFPDNKEIQKSNVITPIIKNILLDGMQTVLHDSFQKDHVEFMRYADDFIVITATKEIATAAENILYDFLRERGLTLSQKMTTITHINNGFDMLDWNFRKLKGGLIVKPSKKAIRSFVASLSNTILNNGKAWKQELLIKKLNQQIRDWSIYNQYISSSKLCAYLDYVLYELLWRWARRRHPHKGKEWILNRYWHRKGNRAWVFSTDNKELFRIGYIPKK